MILRFVCILYLTLPPLTTAQVVDIPDPNLRAEIEYQLKKGRGEPITVDEMATLTYVHEWDDDIEDLTGLEFAINIVEVSFFHNSISDISPLVGLTQLKYLDLGFNSISDISPLAGLTNLMELDLVRNPIMDISPLMGLTNLTDLSFSGNAITDISVLAGLTNLEELKIWKSSISDISSLAELTNLTRLELSGEIVDISVLSGLTNLTELDLGGVSVSDISVLAGLTDLQYLNAESNSITNISVLSGLTNLTELNLTGNLIQDLSPLVANRGFGIGDRIIVEDNPLSDISINTHIPTLWGRGVKVNYAHLFFNPIDLVRVGDRFTVNLHLEGIVDLVGCQLNIAFTSATLAALEVIQGDYFSEDCGQAAFTVGSIDNETGAIRGINLVFDTGCHGGGDVLLSVSFEAKAPGNGELNLHNVAIRTDSVGVTDVGILPFEIIVQSDYDLNGDGQVNIFDLVIVGQNFGQAHPQADVNDDGTVNIFDLTAVAQQFTAEN